MSQGVVSEKMDRSGHWNQLPEDGGLGKGESQARGRTEGRTSGRNTAGVLSGPGTQWPQGSWHRGGGRSWSGGSLRDLVGLI